MKIFFNALRIFCSICGAIAGAGFLSGAELVCFFGTENFILSAAFASALFAILLSVFFKCGEFCFDGGGDVFIRAALFFSDFIFLVGCFAALDSVFECENFRFPLFSIASAVFAFAYSAKGGAGLEKINAVVTPFALVAVNCFLLSYLLKNKIDISYAQAENICAVKPVLYVFMNVFAAMPALRYAKLGKENKATAAGSVLFGAYVFLQSALILLVVISAKTAGKSVPIVAAFLDSRYVLILKVAMFLSVFTSFYCFFLPVCDGAKKLGGNKFAIFVAAIAFVLSRAGFLSVIKYLYPVVGAAGVAAFIKIFIRALKNKGIKREILTDNKRKTEGKTLCLRKRKTKLKN